MYRYDAFSAVNLDALYQMKLTIEMNISSSTPCTSFIIHILFLHFREPLLYSMSRCILAARASGKNIIDGVHLDISDEEGLIKSCVQGRNLGFDGKSLIHPSQILSTNLFFSPSEQEIIHAYKVIESYELALKEGKAVCVVDNKLVEQVRSSSYDFMHLYIT